MTRAVASRRMIIAMVFFLAYINLLSQVLIYAIVAWSLLSWFPIRPSNPAIVILRYITEPILGSLRRVMPRVGMLDLSPVVAIIALIAIPYILNLFLL